MVATPGTLVSFLNPRIITVLLICLETMALPYPYISVFSYILEVNRNHMFSNNNNSKYLYDIYRTLGTVLRYRSIHLNM